MSLFKNDDIMPKEHREILGRPNRTIYDNLDISPVTKEMLYGDAVIRNGPHPAGEKQGKLYTGSGTAKSRSQC